MTSTWLGVRAHSLCTLKIENVEEMLIERQLLRNARVLTGLLQRLLFQEYFVEQNHKRVQCESNYTQLHEQQCPVGK